MKRLPPAATPAPIAPAVQLPEQPPGTGRIVVDVVEASTPVYLARFEPRPQENGRRRQTFRFFELPHEKVCDSTPCVVDLPPGNNLIGFPILGCREGRDFELVHVGIEPSIYRRSLSLYEDNTGGMKVTGIVFTTVGVLATITGAALLPAGISNDNERLAIAGGITLGAGALLTTMGILFLRHDAATFRPGSANHFDAPPAPDPAGDPAGAPAAGAAASAPSAPPPLIQQYPQHHCGWSSARGTG